MRRRRRVTVRCTMTNARPSMLTLVKFFEDFGFTRIILGRASNPISPSPADCTEADMTEIEREEREELTPWLFEQLRKGRIPAWFPHGRMLAESEPEPDTIKQLSMFRCGACRGTMTVGAEGTLYPCHRFVGMKNFAIGHIEEGPEPEAAQAFWRRYDEIVDGRCSHCWARRRCNRPCPWEVAKSDGSFKSPDSQYCNKIRVWIEDALHLRWWLPQTFPALAEKMANGVGIAMPDTD